MGLNERGDPGLLPTREAYGQRLHRIFNGSFRAECLNTSRFLSLEDARSKCEAWRTDYNEVRPHSSIGQKAPIELANASWPACRP